MAIALDAPLAAAGPPGWIAAAGITVATLTAPYWAPQAAQELQDLVGAAGNLVHSGLDAASNFMHSIEGALGIGGSSSAASGPVHQALDDALKGATPQKDSKSKIYEKNGGIDQLQQDFDKVRGNNPVKKVITDSNGNVVGEVAQTPEGNVIERSISSDGRPTLEFQPSNSSEKVTKIRYNPGSNDPGGQPPQGPQGGSPP